MATSRTFLVRGGRARLVRSLAEAGSQRDGPRPGGQGPFVDLLPAWSQLGVQKPERASPCGRSRSSSTMFGRC